MANGKEEDEALALGILLEAPPAIEISSGPVEGAAELFSTDDDRLAELSARFAIADFFLKLLTRDITFKDFTREMLQTVMKVVKSEAGSVLEVDHRNNTLFFRSVVGQSSDSITKFTIPMGQGVVGYVAESRQPLVVDDIEDNKLHLNAIARAVGFETRNLICLPIVIRGRIYGVLELLNRVGEKNFTPSDLKLLTYFCEMAAQAVEIRFMIAWAGQAMRSEKGEAA